MASISKEFYQQRLDAMRDDVRHFVRQIQSYVESLTKRLKLEEAAELAGDTSHANPTRTATSNAAYSSTPTMLYDQQTSGQQSPSGTGSQFDFGSKPSGTSFEPVIACGNTNMNATQMYSDVEKQMTGQANQHSATTDDGRNSSDFCADRLTRLKDMIANQLSPDSDPQK